MRALVTGASGQLGRCLIAAAPHGVEVIAFDRQGLDIGDADTVARVVLRHAPAIVLNAAAYTAVDRAESEEAEAWRINADAIGHLAAACRATGARLAHVSTDFVFDGHAGTPYPPDAPPAPASAYGRTKLAGEHAAGEDALIVRTAWVYAPVGGNFVRTMLRLMAERDTVGVVADQIGTPTYAPALAEAIWRLVRAGAKGLHHYTDSGVASWYDFAIAIQEEALARGLLDRTAQVLPIDTIDYPTPARRPAYSVLDKRATFAALGAPAPHWRVNLRRMLDAIVADG